MTDRYDTLNEIARLLSGAGMGWGHLGCVLHSLDVIEQPDEDLEELENALAGLVELHAEACAGRQAALRDLAAITAVIATEAGFEAEDGPLSAEAASRAVMEFGSGYRTAANAALTYLAARSDAMDALGALPGETLQSAAERARDTLEHRDDRLRALRVILSPRMGQTLEARAREVVDEMVDARDLLGRIIDTDETVGVGIERLQRDVGQNAALWRQASGERAALLGQIAFAAGVAPFGGDLVLAEEALETLRKGRVELAELREAFECDEAEDDLETTIAEAVDRLRDERDEARTEASTLRRERDEALEAFKDDVSTLESLMNERKRACLACDQVGRPVRIGTNVEDVIRELHRDLEGTRRCQSAADRRANDLGEALDVMTDERDEAQALSAKLQSNANARGREYEAMRAQRAESEAKLFSVRRILGAEDRDTAVGAARKVMSKLHDLQAFAHSLLGASAAGLECMELPQGLIVSEAPVEAQSAAQETVGA